RDAPAERLPQHPRRLGVEIARAEIGEQQERGNDDEPDGQRGNHDLKSQVSSNKSQVSSNKAQESNAPYYCELLLVNCYLRLVTCYLIKLVAPSGRESRSSAACRTSAVRSGTLFRRTRSRRTPTRCRSRSTSTPATAAAV